jgi:toxin ParE1/3/4
MKLRYAPRAYADIADIYENIAKYNDRAAVAVVKRIRTTCELVARFPDLGRETDIAGVRVFPIARFPYLVYYRLRENEPVIIHVLGTATNRPTASFSFHRAL